MLRKMVTGLLFFSLLMFGALAGAEPTHVYPNTGSLQQHWKHYNVPYVLSEYDKIASKPGCAEWLAKTGAEEHRAHHEVNEYRVEEWMFLAGAKNAGWVIESDYMKPVVGAIVYLDSEPNTPEYRYTLRLVRAIQDGKVILESMDDTGQVIREVKPISSMANIGGTVFRGYIYPWKIGEHL